ncbi:MAG: hypothetical protein O3C57_07810, partial [Verrucomicrobia bacterium]|nr:hypothetical protein [Verrucomicrobiota bacterium]
MFRSRVRRRIRRWMALILCILLACLFYLNRVGVPQWIKHRVMRRISEGNIAVEAHHVRCNVLRSLDVDGLRLYRRGQIGPAFLSAEHVIITLDPLAVINATRLVQQVRMDDVTIMPGLMGRTSDSDHAAPADFLELDVELNNAMLDEIHIQRLTGHFRRDASGFLLSNLKAILVDKAGDLITLQGQVSYDEREDVYAGRLMVEGEPNFFVAPLRTWGLRVAAEIISRFAFQNTTPRVLVSFHRKSDAANTWFVDGRVWLEQGTYNAVNFMRADGTYSFEVGKSNLVFKVDPLLVVREEGLARGNFVYVDSTESNTLDFQVSSSLDPHALAGIVGVLTNLVSRDYQFKDPYRVEAHGQYDFLAPDKTCMSADIDLGGIKVGKIDLLDPSFSWQRTGCVSEFPALRAQFCDGVVIGKGYLAKPVGTEVTSAFFSGDWRGIDLKGFADRMLGEGKHKFSGEMRGHLHLIGVTGKENRHSWAGNGDLRITDGQILSLPVFGGLTDYLGKVLPGVNLLVNQTEARGTYRIGGSMVRFDEVRVEGDVLSLQGKGSCDFDRELDFGVELNFFKANTVVGKIVRLPTW